MTGPLIDRRAHKHRGNAELRDAFPALVAEWGAYWRQQPWHPTVAADAPDTLLEVLRAILDAAMGETDSVRPHERLLHAAVAHGEQRCRQGVSDEALLGEYHALRKALWRHLLHSAPAAENLTTIFRVDVVISAASGLALRGFTRGLVPADFPWERELARAMTEVSENLVRALV
ncbi:MAG TPA: hypothetical protein VGP84_10590 [Gemmatimonadaceae bacterium]|jgi:hypothetical protein|nr:hypothetical protein [Gemmatimonadaceae bacterium]